MIEVRSLRREDIPAMLDGCERLHAESRFAHMDFDRGKYEAKIETGLIVPEHFFVEVLIVDGVFAGALFAQAGESSFGKDWLAEDIVFFVLPEYRGRFPWSLKRMVDRYAAWAKSRGAKITDLRTGTGIKPDRTAEFFEHIGALRVGSTHSLAVN